MACAPRRRERSSAGVCETLALQVDTFALAALTTLTLHQIHQSFKEDHTTTVICAHRPFALSRLVHLSFDRVKGLQASCPNPTPNQVEGLSRRACYLCETLIHHEVPRPPQYLFRPTACFHYHRRCLARPQICQQDKWADQEARRRFIHNTGGFVDRQAIQHRRKLCVSDRRLFSSCLDYGTEF